MREALPGVADGTRDQTGALITEIQACSDAPVDMFCAYLATLAHS